jgi:hypothetical protein
MRSAFNFVPLNTKKPVNLHPLEGSGRPAKGAPIGASHDGDVPDSKRKDYTFPNMSQAPRIVITKRTTWPRLFAQIEERSGETLLITGTGARARRLEERLALEVPNVLLGRSPDGLEYLAYVNPDGPPLVWRHDERGKAPVVVPAHLPHLSLPYDPDP